MLSYTGRRVNNRQNFYGLGFAHISSQSSRKTDDFLPNFCCRNRARFTGASVNPVSLVSVRIASFFTHCGFPHRNCSQHRIAPGGRPAIWNEVFLLYWRGAKGFLLDLTPAEHEDGACLMKYREHDRNLGSDVAWSFFAQTTFRIISPNGWIFNNCFWVAMNVKCGTVF